MQKRKTIKLKDILRNAYNREQQINTLPLLLYREERGYILPDIDQKLKFGDRILFCGNAEARTQHHWIVNDDMVLRFILTGEEYPGGYIWRWLTELLSKRKI